MLSLLKDYSILNQTVQARLFITYYYATILYNVKESELKNYIIHNRCVLLFLHSS